MVKRLARSEPREGLKTGRMAGLRCSEVAMKRTVMLLLICCFPAMVLAELRTEVVEYRDGDTILEGYLAYDDVAKMKQPGVLVVPDWMGLQDHYKEVAEKLAGMGYVAFAADIYGKGIRPSHAKEAAAHAAESSVGIGATEETRERGSGSNGSHWILLWGDRDTGAGTQWG